MRQEAPRFENIKKYLGEKHDFPIMRAKTPLLSGEQKLSILTSCKIPIDSDLAESILDNFIASDDVEGVRKIHSVGVGDILLRTTFFLLKSGLQESYRNFKKGDGAESPLDMMKSIFTHDVIRRFRSTEYPDLIEDEIAMFIDETVSFSALGEAGSLRDLVDIGVLEEAEEKRIEEWILEKTKIKKDWADGFRSGRITWLARKIPKEEVIDYSSLPYDSQYSIVSNLIMCNPGDTVESINHSIFLLEGLKLEDQASLASFLPSGFTGSGRDIMVAYLRKLSERVGKEVVNKKDKKKFRLIFARKFLYNGELEDFSSTLNKADKKGTEALAKDLGVNQEDLVYLLAWAHVDEATKKNFRTEDALISLLNRKYFTNNKEEIATSVRHGYKDLLMLRILAFGEEGIGYPDITDLEENINFVDEIAIAFRERGDIVNLKRWLKCLKKLEMDSSIKTILDGKYKGD